MKVDTAHTKRLAGPLARVWAWWTHAELLLNVLQPLVALLARCYVAQVFFLSGLTKLRDWETTLALFQDEYHVPGLPPDIAAVLGTSGELVLPVLLVLGLGSRFAALGLCVVNAVAVVSLAEISPQALQQHIAWGLLLLGTVAWGGGSWSLDRLIRWGMARRE